MAKTQLKTVLLNLKQKVRISTKISNIDENETVNADKSYIESLRLSLKKTSKTQGSAGLAADLDMTYEYEFLSSLSQVMNIY